MGTLGANRLTKISTNIRYAREHPIRVEALPPTKQAILIVETTTYTPRRQTSGLPRRDLGRANQRRKTSTQEANHTGSEHKTTSLFVLTFLIGLVIPWIIFVGPVRLSAYRVILLVTFVPCLLIWATGRAGRIRMADIFVFLYAGWCSLSLIVVHGFSEAIQSSGILFIETVGSYLLARCYIRNSDDFRKLVSILFAIFIVLLPFAAIEAVTGVNVSRKFFSIFMQSFPDTYSDPRWGLRRVQSVFEHPILFGVCSASIFAMTYLVLGYGESFVKRGLKTGLVGATAFLSLSAGPISALAVQGMLLIWNSILANNIFRWKILWLIIIIAYLFISVLSNQSVPAFYITHFSFQQESAYYRILIWEFGTNSVLHHPVFGTGFGEWLRPSWMPPSIDMFWLTHAVFYGLPGAILMGLIFFSAYLPISFKNNLPNKENNYRLAYIIAMTGFFLVGWTVHFWNASYVLFIFILGSGIWILDCCDNKPPAVSRHAVA